MELFLHQKLTKIKLIYSFVLLFTFNSFAQHSSEYMVYKEQYPNSHSVRLNQETLIRITLKNDEIGITQEFLEEDIYLDEAATYRSKKSLNFSSFFEINNIEASSFNYENGKHKESKVQIFKEKDELDQFFYDDTKSVNFIYSNLSNGSKTKLKYTQKVKNPRFLSSFYFGDFFPIANNKITVIADKKIKLEFKEFNLQGLNIKFTKKEKRGNIIYTWESKNIDEYEYEENVPTYTKILPHIVPIIKSYVSDGSSLNLLNDVSDLYSWYYSLVKDVNKENSDENLVKLVDKLTADKNSDLEKVKAIYYWTQQNIKYIAFEYALGGFIPREANDIYQKKYGDCKDNSSILHEMLKIAGLNGNLTWIGTRKIPYKYTEVPTPIVDNHMILSYSDKENTYFLDATGRYLSYNFPSSFIQGKEALIANGEGKFKIKKVPVMPSENNALIDSSYIHIVNENIVGNSKTEISGYKKVNFFFDLEEQNTESKTREFYNIKLQKGSNKFLIKKLNEVNKYKYDTAFVVKYDFTINQYIKKLGDEMYINMNLNQKLSEFKTDKDRKYAIKYDYKDYYNFNTTLNIPEGYTVNYIPENIDISNDYVSFKITYDVEESQIIYSNSIKLDFLTLNILQQKEVNDLIKKAEKSYKEIVILKKQ